VKQSKVAQILASDEKRRSRGSMRVPSGDGSDQFSDGLDDPNRRLSKS
jgi:hypothetical protein